MKREQVSFVPVARRFAKWASILFFAGLAITMGASSASAQTHPCDQVVANNPTIVVTGPVSVGFCFNGKDALGNPTTVTSFRVQVDAADVFTGLLQPVGAPSSTGVSYYETPKTLTINRGSHTALVFVSNADGEGPASSPFAFNIRVPPGQGKVQSVNK